MTSQKLGTSRQSGRTGFEVHSTGGRVVAREAGFAGYTLRKLDGSVITI